MSVTSSPTHKLHQTDDLDPKWSMKIEDRQSHFVFHISTPLSSSPSCIRYVFWKRPRKLQLDVTRFMMSKGWHIDKWVDDRTASISRISSDQ